MNVKTGDKVKIEYTGTLDNGTIFDSSEEHGRPLEFQVGSGHVIKGFNDAILGMKAGDEKQFSVSPAEAYGEHDSPVSTESTKRDFPKGC